MSETVKIRNPAHVDLTIHVEGEKIVLDARSTQEIEL